jgi:predicted nucleic acid-binding protein
MIFFDTSYLVRLYLDEPGADAVRELAKAQPISTSWHAQAELLCTFHRAFREGRLDHEGYHAQRAQFYSDETASAFHWLPVSTSTLARLDLMLANAPATSFLRAADALHLACAAEHGFKEVYSNDRHFLAAAPLFGLKGINAIDMNGA